MKVTVNNLTISKMNKVKTVVISERNVITKVQQNSIYLTHTGPDMFQIIRFF